MRVLIESGRLKATKVGSTWLVGDRRLSRGVISDLEKMRLVREVTAGGSPVLTYIGEGD